jgi:membrane-associated phospholipid phosphatase
MPPLEHLLYDWLGLNRALFLLINGTHGAVWDRFMVEVSEVASPGNFSWYMAAVLVLARAAPRLGPVQNAFVFGIGFAAVELIDRLIKLTPAMPRPTPALGADAVTVLDHTAAGTSFPSGHAVFTALLAASLWPGAPRLLRWALLAFAILAGLSRIVLGVHFPADVMGGALIGVVTALVVRAVFAHPGGSSKRGR